MIEIPVTPIPAPRQSRRDIWNPRPCVVRYRNYRDEIEAYAHNLDLIKPFEIIFHMPFPKSYSKKKKEILRGEGHKQKPDLDNLLKAFLDSVYRFSDDAHIWKVTASKIWSDEGKITIIGGVK